MEIDLKENEWLAWLGLTLVIALALVGFAYIGQNATPIDAATGEARVITWNDWQALQARRAHNRELAVLRADLAAIAQTFQFPPDPVSAQILRARILQHTQGGQPTLEMARAFVQNAADGLVSWSSGQIERAEMIAFIQQAEAALK